MRVALLIAMVLASTTARADDGMLDEFIRQCEARGGHVEHDPNGGSTCVEASSSGGGGGGGQANPAAAQAAGKVFASIFITIGFAFMPGHVAELISDGPKQTAKQAHDDWNQYAAKRQTLIKAGKDAETSSTAYWKLDAEERAQLRDAGAPKPKLKPFNPPHLKPDLHYMCDQAKLLLPSTHTTGAVGMFVNEGDMVGKCSQFTEPPVDPDRSCAANTLACGLSNPDVCCPTGYPIYNPCSEKCYRTTDFVAGPDPGLHCNTSRDCGARQTP
ncbi:MAG TPA: hypothetical protein VL326_27975 [Kofleriaceae bacterium]|nr:hypothetical protein [Kofleriaceae bacterium]